MSQQLAAQTSTETAATSSVSRSLGDASVIVINHNHSKRVQDFHQDQVHHQDQQASSKPLGKPTMGPAQKTLFGLLVLAIAAGGLYLALTWPTSSPPAPVTAQQGLDTSSPSRLSAPAASGGAEKPPAERPTTLGRFPVELPATATVVRESEQQQPTVLQTTAGLAETSSKMFGEPGSTQEFPATTTTPAPVHQEPASSNPEPVQIQNASITLLSEPLPPSPSPPTPTPTEPDQTTSPAPTLPAETSPPPPATPVEPSTATPPTAKPSAAEEPDDLGQLEASWQQFKLFYRRLYRDQAEETARRQIFINNSLFIRQHNEQKDSTYKLGINHFADFTRDEINNLFIGPQISWMDTKSQFRTLIPEPMSFISDLSSSGETMAPQFKDWRNITAGQPVDQGACREGSVFAAVASLEAALNLHTFSSNLLTWQPIKLAESQVFDCMPQGPLGPCSGFSSMAHIFQLLQQVPTGGLANILEHQEYKRQAQRAACEVPAPIPTGSDQPPRAKLSTFNVIHPDNIPEALLNSGPLVVALDATQSSFHFYKSGLYQDPNCSTDTYNHHALLVGYQAAGAANQLGGEPEPNGISDSSTPSTTTNAQYLVRNSFGLDWGEAGHMRLLKADHNKCLPQTMAISPNLAV